MSEESDFRNIISAGTRLLREFQNGESALKFYDQMRQAVDDSTRKVEALRQEQAALKVENERVRDEIADRSKKHVAAINAKNEEAQALVDAAKKQAREIVDEAEKRAAEIADSTAKTSEKVIDDARIKLEKIKAEIESLDQTHKDNLTKAEESSMALEKIESALAEAKSRARKMAEG